MSYNSAGVYSAFSGMETAVAGNVVQSAVWDGGHADMRGAFSAIGQGALGSNDWNNLLSANGGFEVWQRGAGSSASITVAASNTAYTADRWYITTGVNQNHTISAAAGLTSASRLSGKISRDSGQTGTTAVVFGFPLDTDEVVRLRGQKVSISFYAATGANWSPTSGAFTATLYVGTGAVAKRGGGFTSETNVLAISTNLAAGTGATLVSGISSSTVPTNVTQGELQFSWTPTGTAGANDYIQFDDVQLEASSFVQQGFIGVFERLPLPVMLDQCKRHARKTFPYSVAPAQGAGLPGALSVITQAAAQFGIYWQFEPVALRATASYTTYNPSGASANWQDATAGASLAVTIDTANGSSPSGVLIYGATAAAANDLVYIHAFADSSI